MALDGGSFFDEELQIKHEPEVEIIDVYEKPPEQKSPRRGALRSPPGKGEISADSNNRSCDICGHINMSENALKYHMKQHLRQVNLTSIPGRCELCNKHMKNLAFHMEVFHSKTKFTCNICGFSTKYEANLTAHKKKHLPEKGFSCAVCNRKFKDQSNRNRHQRDRHRKTLIVVYECPICPHSVTFSRSDNLNVHLKRIHGKIGSKEVKDLFQCDGCASTFVTKFSLTSHMKNIHLKLKKKTWSCSICSKTFVAPNSLEAHLTSEHLKKFKCRYCSKLLGSARTLKTHESKGQCR